MGWFILVLEVQICFWSLAAWTPASCTWAFPLCIPVLYGELIPPSSLSLISPPFKERFGSSDLFLILGCMNYRFLYLSFSTLHSSSLWRTDTTIFTKFDKPPLSNKSPFQKEVCLWLPTLKRCPIHKFIVHDINPLSPKSDSIKFLLVISMLSKTEWSWELQTRSHKINLLDILSTSPHYFCRKWIGATNENSNLISGFKGLR